MALNIRKTQPECVRFILQTIQNDMGSAVQVPIEKFVNVLINNANYSKSLALETIHNAIHDGLLVQTAGPSSNSAKRGRLREQKWLRLAKLPEVAKRTHDNYCFECHLPGILEPCSQCSRTFHRLCCRKNPDRPNYSVPSGKTQKNRLPVYRSEAPSESDDNDRNTIGDDSDMRATSSLLPNDQNSMVSSTSQRLDETTADGISVMDVTAATTDGTVNSISSSDDKPAIESFYDMESKDRLDVVCMGLFRPPNRKRPATASPSVSYKTEIVPTEDDNADAELCTCCRLLKMAVMRNPPNMEMDELCYLLQCTFTYNRSWITTDIVQFFGNTKLLGKEVKVITKFLFNMPGLSLKEITTKLQTQSYTYIMEFLVDILDFQHNMGVFFGVNSTEFESTKWLVRDISHDISEIRRCPDCFRHSHEKGSALWFAKPCLQRHELVYAKHSGFPYWPAKVIRVLGNNKYDVRFFGGDHSRALIDVHNIRPIDTDIKTLKMRNTLQLRKALEELHNHQLLLAYPASKFSYHADKCDNQRILCAVMEESVENTFVVDFGTPTRTRRRSRSFGRSKSLTPRRSISRQKSREPDEDEDVSSVKRIKKTVEPTTPKRLTRSSNHSEVNVPMLQKKLNELEKSNEGLQRDNEKLQAQVMKLRETMKKHEYEKKVIKRKQWCHWCLQDAIYACCFKASYCSEICQARHWKDGHNKVCKSEDN